MVLVGTAKTPFDEKDNRQAAISALLNTAIIAASELLGGVGKEEWVVDQDEDVEIGELNGAGSSQLTSARCLYVFFSILALFFEQASEKL